MIINVLHVTADRCPDEIQQFIKDNINNIDIVRISTENFIEELHACGFLSDHGGNGINSLLSIRKMANRVFNNDYIKERTPLSTPEFICEISNEMAIREIADSYLALLYYNNKPVFITDVDKANNIFGGSIRSKIPLLGSEVDYSLFHNVLGMYDYKLFVLNDEVPTLNMYELAMLGADFPEYTIVIPGDILPERTNTFDYDTMIEDNKNG